MLAAWRDALGVEDPAASRSVVVRDDLDVVVLLEILGRRWSAAPPRWAEVLQRDPDTDPHALLRASPAMRTLGTADLLYSDSAPRAPETAGDVRPATAGDLDLLRAGADAQEWDESGADQMHHRWVAVDAAGIVQAVAGYTPWRDTVAQMGVFTAARGRGAGHAGRASAVAVDRALREHAVAQWRSRRGNAASLALGTRLGFVVLGWQSTFVPADPAPGG